ncbi:MAG: hypothetical protein IPJ79_13355 [Bacteroidetes bacterium]|nr:hypothetical protein [Bacteroidota bacterium]
MNKTLNISMLSPGAYIINIQTTKQNLYGEFIKLLLKIYFALVNQKLNIMKHLLTILLTTLTITSIQAQNYRWAHGFAHPIAIAAHQLTYRCQW